MRRDLDFSRPANPNSSSYIPAEMAAAGRKPRPVAGQIWRHLKYGLHRVQMVSTWWSTGAVVVTVVPLPTRSDQANLPEDPTLKTYSIEEFAVAFAPNQCIGCGVDLTGQPFTRTVVGLTCAQCDPEGEGKVPPPPSPAPVPAHPLCVMGLAPAPLFTAQIAEETKRAVLNPAPLDCSTPNVVPPIRTGPRRK